MTDDTTTDDAEPTARHESAVYRGECAACGEDVTEANEHPALDIPYCGDCWEQWLSWSDDEVERYAEGLA